MNVKGKDGKIIPSERVDIIREKIGKKALISVDEIMLKCKRYSMKDIESIVGAPSGVYLVFDGDMVHGYVEFVDSRVEQKM